MAYDRPSPARAIRCGSQTRAPESRARIFPDTPPTATPPPARAIQSPTAPRLKPPRQYCNGAGQGSEFPPSPVPESGIPHSPPDADLRMEFDLDELSFAKPFRVHRLNFLFSALA